MAQTRSPTTPTINRPRMAVGLRGWEWFLLPGAFGLQVGVSIDALGYMQATLAALTPLAAAWLVAQHGPNAIAPLLAYALLPELTLEQGGYSLTWGPAPPAFFAVGIAAGVCWSMQHEPDRWQGVFRPQHPVWALGAVGLALWLALEWPVSWHNWQGLGVSASATSAPICLLGVAWMRWRSLGGRWVFAVPALLLTGGVCALSLRLGWVSAYWGLSWTLSLVTAAVAIGVLARRPSLPWWIGVLVAVFALEGARIALGWLPLSSHWSNSVDATRATPPRMLFNAASNAAAAVLVALSLGTCLVRASRGPARRSVVFAWAAMGLVLMITPGLVDPQATFSSLDTRAWLVGGAAFVLAWAGGARGMVLVPLGATTLALLGGLQEPNARMWVHAAGVGALTGAYAFAGWLVQRQSAALRQVPANLGASAIDVTALAHLVHRLDVSATLRSFGLLLVVLGVAAAWVQTGLGAAAAIGLHELWTESWSPDLVAGILLVALAGAALAMLPLSFMLTDALQRQDRLRPFTALGGAVLASAAHLGAGLLWAGGLAVLAAVLYEGGDFSAADLEPGMLLAPLAIVISLVLLARSVWLRADLALPIPRGWLYASIGRGGFWRRLACLLGLPASLWSRNAFGERALWHLLTARPLVYAGGALLGTWAWWLSLPAVVLGHASFAWGKRLAARRPWRAEADLGPAPVFFLRSFEDDQFDFRLAGRNALKRWLALWSFRRNLDEVLVDEAASVGPVVALGRPGEQEAPFGAMRHYAEHSDWQEIVVRTARRARCIVIAAGSTPGVLWEYDMLEREDLLGRTLLVFCPGQTQSNRAAFEAFASRLRVRPDPGGSDPADWVALLMQPGHAVLLTSTRREPAAWVLALRMHLQGWDPDTARVAAQLAPPPGKLAIT